LTAQVKKNENSPAMTLSMSHLLGTISDYKELLKVDLQSVSNNDAAAEMECVIHLLLGFNGIDYTREHAEIVNDFSSLIKAAWNRYKDVPFFVLMLDIRNKMKKLLIRVQETESRSKNKILYNGDHKNVTPVKGDKCASQTTAENCSQRSCAPVKPRSCNAYSDHRPPTVFKGSSTMNTNSAIQEFSKNPVSRQRSEGDGVEDKSEDKENWNSIEGEEKSNTKRQPEAKREGLTYGVGNEAMDQNEESELKRKFSRWIEGMIPAVKTNESHEKHLGDTERVKNGIDLIPAFRSHGWPKATREWIKKDRKWPSPDIVSKVINEGYHLVAKSAKKNGNPDCDFRLSFSHAEYLLSQEMNEIQRDCYVCLKKIHRAYLCTRPKSLVSFHLKNILLQTIEETGAEMWTDSNRAECMMVLLKKLLTALAAKDLRHFFVRAYNLFGVDYIENPQSLEFLAMKVEEIIDNPMRFSKQLIQNREKTREETKEECVSQKIFLEGDQSEPVPLLSAKAPQESCTAGSYRYHDLKDVYQEVTEELIRLASHENEDKAAAMDPLEMSVVKDLIQLARKYNIPVGVFPVLCNALWHKRAYYWIWISTEPDIRRRVLVAIRGGLQIVKHHLKQDHLREGKNGETFEAFFDRIFDPAIENPFHLDHELPSDDVLKLMHKVANSLRNSSVKDLREMGEKYVHLTHPDFSEFFDLFWKALEGRISNESDAEYRLLVKLQVFVKSAMVHRTKEDKHKQGENNDVCENLNQRLVGAFCSFIAGKIRQNVAKNSGRIP